MKKKISGLGFPLFFILPISGFCTSLFDLKSKSTAFIYVLFAMVVGYSISFTDASADSFRYAEAFSRFDNTLDYNRIVNLYLDGELRDLYRLLLFYIVSLFSNNPKVMYAFAGLVYGSFSYMCIRIFVKERGENFDFYTFILALIFFTYVSLSNLNSFRFNTGAVFFFISVYNYIINKKPIWIIGILMTPLFHYGFILVVPVMIIYKLIDKILIRTNKINSILFYCFIIAFMASWVLKTNSISLGFLSQNEALSGAVGQRLSYVNSSDVANLVENRRENSVFLSIQKIFDYGIKIYVFLMIIYLKKLHKNLNDNNRHFTKLFSFVLFFYTFSFIATSFPSGARFLNISHLFFVLLVVKYYSIFNSKKIKSYILWAIPVFSFNIAFINGMIPFLILTPTFWYGNVFWIIIEGLDFYV